MNQSVRTYLGWVLGLSLGLQSLAAITVGLLPSGAWVYMLGLLLAAVPGLAAWKAAQHRAYSPPWRNPESFWPIDWTLALRLAGAVLGVFAVANGLAALLGWSPPDWTLSELAAALPHYRDVGLSEPVSPAFLLSAGLLLTFGLGLTMYALAAAAFEAGWRGMLLPMLLPQGRLKAYVTTGLFFGLALAPVVYAGAIGHGGLGETFRWCLLSMIMGVILGEIWRRTRHVGLVAVVAGSVASQMHGVWLFLFPDPIDWLAGPVGMVHLVCWTAIAAVAYRWPESESDAAASSNPQGSPSLPS